MTHPQLLARIATLEAELEKARAERDALRALVRRALDERRCDHAAEPCSWCEPARAALESTPAPDVTPRPGALVAFALYEREACAAVAAAAGGNVGASIAAAIRARPPPDAVAAMLAPDVEVIGTGRTTRGQP